MAGGKKFEVQDMPLFAWKKGKEGFAPPKEATSENATMLGFNLVPTESDSEAMKMLYPWEG